MDYGDAWQQAWDEHVASWESPEDADQYVYPEQMDDTQTLRTVKEQKDDPYPSSVMVSTQSLPSNDVRGRTSHFVQNRPCASHLSSNASLEVQLNGMNLKMHGGRATWWYVSIVLFQRPFFQLLVSHSSRKVLSHFGSKLR